MIGAKTGFDCGSSIRVQPRVSSQYFLFNTQKYSSTESHMHISFPIWGLEDVSSIFVPRVDSRGDVSFVFHA